MSATLTALAAAVDHDPAGCMDLDCQLCCPEYVPGVGDFVKDVMGNVWEVTSTCTARGGFIELKHTVYGHYANAPRTESGAFHRGGHVKVDGPGA